MIRLYVFSFQRFLTSVLVFPIDFNPFQCYNLIAKGDDHRLAL